MAANKMIIRRVRRAIRAKNISRVSGATRALTLTKLYKVVILR
jgi:hypothetical protein